MPTIIVRKNGSANEDDAVMLSEDVQPEHLASSHHAAQLIQRLGSGMGGRRRQGRRGSLVQLVRDAE